MEGLSPDFPLRKLFLEGPVCQNKFFCFIFSVCLGEFESWSKICIIQRSAFPIAIQLRKYYRNIGLTQLSDQTLTIGLATLDFRSRISIGLTEIYRTRNGQFLLFLCLFQKSRRSEEFSANELLASIRTVYGISVAVSVPADARTVAGVSTCAVAASCCYGSSQLLTSVMFLLSLLLFIRLVVNLLVVLRVPAAVAGVHAICC